MEEKKENNVSPIEKSLENTSLSVNRSDIQNDMKSDMTLTPSTTMTSEAPSLLKKGPKLTTKDRSFLEHLLAGKSTQEAYRLAGFKGKGSAAYQLRLRLKEELRTALESEGLDRTGIKIRLKRLLEKGEAGLDTLSSISPKMYLETLKFLASLDKDVKDVDVKISPFVIQTDTVNIHESTKTV